MTTFVAAGFDFDRARPPHVWMRRCVSATPYVFAVAVALVLLAPLVSLAFGYRVFVVTSGSMEPTARTGDALLLRRVGAPEVRVGDVITFRPLREGGARTHRVISVHDVEGSGLHFRTRGDANDDPDPNLVPASNVLGRVVTVVPRIGREYLRATTPAGRLVLVGLPAFLIISREVLWLGRRRIVRWPVQGRAKRRLATLIVAAMAGTSVAGPSAASFADSAPVGSNTISTGQLNAPTNLNGSAQLVPCRVNLTWTAPASGLTPDGYDILRSTASGGPYSFRKHVTTTSGSDDTGPLSALTTYHYVVRSTRSAWTSSTSNEKAITTLLCAL